MACTLSTAEKLHKLRLFNEKAEVLRRRNFTHQVFRPNHGFTLNADFEKQQASVERRGADEESLHAFVTTLRLFVQPRDGIMIDQIADIYESLPVEDMAKQSARAAANSLEDFFNSPVGLNMFGEDITRRRLFEVFMYGNLVHANDDKRQAYERWTRDPFAAAFLTTFLEETIAQVTNFIFSFRQMNDRTIEQLESALQQVP